MKSYAGFALALYGFIGIEWGVTDAKREPAIPDETPRTERVIGIAQARRTPRRAYLKAKRNALRFGS